MIRTSLLYAWRDHLFGGGAIPTLFQIMHAPQFFFAKFQKKYARNIRIYTVTLHFRCSGNFPPRKSPCPSGNASHAMVPSSEERERSHWMPCQENMGGEAKSVSPKKQHVWLCPVQNELRRCCGAKRPPWTAFHIASSWQPPIISSGDFSSLLLWWFAPYKHILLAPHHGSTKKRSAPPCLMMDGSQYKNIQ